MKRLLLDHFRRWWWVLALAGLLEFWLGWWIARRPQDPFEFWALLIALWAGSNLLSFDFKRGALRPIAALPLTDQEFGRCWWLATVPIPAVGLAGLLFLGAAVAGQLHPEYALPCRQLALGSLFTFVWLGSGFPMTFGATRGLGGNWRQMLGNFVLSALSMLMLFGSMLWGQGAAENPLKCAALLGLGGLLTLVGWVDARRLNIGRSVQFYRGRPEVQLGAQPQFPLTPLEPRSVAGQGRLPDGAGGLTYFILSRVTRMFLLIGSMSALTAALWVWQGSSIPTSTAIVVYAGTGSLMSCGVVLIFQLLPALRHLRLLRTLPISVFGLSSTLLAVILLPLMALGAVSAVIAGGVLGRPAAITFLTDYAFVLAPASVGAFLAAWLGEGKLSYALLLITFFGSQQVQLRLQTSMHLLELPLRLSTTIAAGSVLLALLLISGVIRYSRLAYRPRGIAPGTYPFGLGG